MFCAGENISAVEVGGSFDQAVRSLEEGLLSGHQGERQSVPSPQTHHNILLQNENEEQDQVSDSFKSLQLGDGGTAESLDSDRRESLEVANGKMGFEVRVGGRLENEEVGVKSLLRLASSAGSSQISDIELVHNKQQQEDEVERSCVWSR